MHTDTPQTSCTAKRAHLPELSHLMATITLFYHLPGSQPNSRARARAHSRQFHFLALITERIALWRAFTLAKQTHCYFSPFVLRNPRAGTFFFSAERHDCGITIKVEEDAFPYPTSFYNPRTLATFYDDYQMHHSFRTSCFWCNI